MQPNVSLKRVLDISLRYRGDANYCGKNGLPNARGRRRVSHRLLARLIFISVVVSMEITIDSRGTRRKKEREREREKNKRGKTSKEA